MSSDSTIFSKLIFLFLCSVYLYASKCILRYNLTTYLLKVTKRLWAYLKEHNLQDSENRQYFTPDETMAKVFGSEKIKCFSMSKYLKEHLTK